MKLSSILVARAIYFLDSADLNPKGRLYTPDIAREVVERYAFKTFPKSPEEWDESKGVTFESGKSGEHVIEKVVLYNWGITLDTRTDTSVSELLLTDALSWLMAKQNIEFDTSIITRRSYLSQVSFHSDIQLFSLHPVLEFLAQAITKSVTEDLRLPSKFEASGVLLALDPAEQRVPLPRFTIERRERSAFSDGKYFSSAPLKTRTHIELLNYLEKTLESDKTL